MSVERYGSVFSKGEGLNLSSSSVFQCSAEEAKITGSIIGQDHSFVLFGPQFPVYKPLRKSHTTDLAHVYYPHGYYL